VPSKVTIRRAVPEDAGSILRVRHAAIYGKAASHYTVEQLAAWFEEAPLTPDAIEKQAQFIGDEGTYTYVAEHNGTIIGFSAVVPAQNELRRVFVAPGQWSGVGGQLLTHAEAQARKLELTHLNCEASVNAENFYAKHGYEVVERGMYRTQSGVEAPCVKMKKHFPRKA